MPKAAPKPTIHMIKLCVGVATLEELESYRAERAHWWGADYGEDVHVHRTRTRPKRAAELEAERALGLAAERSPGGVESAFSQSRDRHVGWP